jgi:hypothetical protein
MFPGAAYHAPPTATGVRGRALRGQEPLRWARVEARLNGAADPVGRAHGDERGEFLLLLASAAAGPGDLQPTLDATVAVFGPEEAPEPPTGPPGAVDPLWGLPLEILPVHGFVDRVSTGEELPSGYREGQGPASTSTRLVTFWLGALRVEQDPFVFA